ncbi:MAG: tRNA lysidine(34) synthetase TilS [Bacteroidales bacterium]|jgi:tRNA(Ile)-lysidine synthase|nr:tRNA lysidine(34) synthetase TilS [Bacteroidales bacterium]
MLQYKYIDKNKPVLVAVSGGADSVAMLHMLVGQGYYCIAAHCNFHLRGAESDADEVFVRSFCEELGVPCYVEHFDTRKYAQQKSVSIEMAARELRYQWFYSLLDKYDIPCVAVAHHADDAAETFMLNLVRGTGLKGLTGMKPVQGRVVRPMLRYSRQDIELYCRAHRLKFCTDSTNQSDAYVRNRIRHHVIPQLKTINPSFLRTMRNNMAHLNQIYSLFAQQASEFMKRAVVELEDQTLISMDNLQKLPEVEPFIFEILFPKGFSPDSIHKIARCVAEKRWGRILFSSKYRVIVDRFNLMIMPRDEQTENEETDIEMDQDEVYTPIHLKISTFERTDDYQVSKDANIAHFNADKVYFPLTLRHWRTGDMFRPLGMKGFKKLSDFFVDNKMNQVQKENAWILEAGGEIIWIVGMRIDDRFKITADCKEVLQIEIITN